MTEMDSSSDQGENLPPKGALREVFNRKAGVCEAESKFIVTNDDREVFQTVEDYFRALGWIKHSSEPKHLLSRQLDTTDQALLKLGDTVRVRGNCDNADLNTVKETDICIKSGKTKNESGDIVRNEYETESGFDSLNIEGLREKYPAADYPELHETLDRAEKEGLLEFFRIDCRRTVHHLVISGAEAGLREDQDYVAELIMDDVVFVLDVEGLKSPLIFHYDLEIEKEAMLKPDSHSYVPDGIPDQCSSDLTQEDLERLEKVVNEHIMIAGNGNLRPNHISKAERGFNGLNKIMASLNAFLQPAAADRPEPEDASSLRAAFSLNQRDEGGGKAHEIEAMTAQRLAEVIRRPIATRQP